VRLRCSSCRHRFDLLPQGVQLLGMFVIDMIEYAAFMYLRALSFNSIIAILRAWYEKKVLAKNVLIDHIERLADLIPEQIEVTVLLKPRRSGYYALDGTWFKYRGMDLVLLIILDVVTLDLVNWTVAREECAESYQKLIDPVKSEITADLKGFFCDGDPGLLKVLKEYFPNIPVQLCVFHKYSRIGQIIPFIRIKKPIDREIKQKVEAVLFAPTKEEAIAALDGLKRYAREHQSYKKLQEIIGVLMRNFDLLLTHFDHPAMSPYNNVLEGFNHCLKRRLRLMKGFKKPVNINRWLKLILLDWRFHPLVESSFKDRRGKSPLQLAGCQLPPLYNWIKFARVTLGKMHS
jgi:transposase-like protein